MNESNYNKQLKQQNYFYHTKNLFKIYNDPPDNKITKLKKEYNKNNSILKNKPINISKVIHLNNENLNLINKLNFYKNKKPKITLDSRQYFLSNMLNKKKRKAITDSTIEKENLNMVKRLNNTQSIIKYGDTVPYNILHKKNKSIDHKSSFNITWFKIKNIKNELLNLKNISKLNKLKSDNFIFDKKIKVILTKDNNITNNFKINLLFFDREMEILDIKLTKNIINIIKVNQIKNANSVKVIIYNKNNSKFSYIYKSFSVEILNSNNTYFNLKNNIYYLNILFKFIN